MVRTNPIEDVDEANEETNDGVSKTAISNAARVANLANLKKGRKGKKKRNGLAVISAKKSVCVKELERLVVYKSWLEGQLKEVEAVYQGKDKQ